MKLAKSMWRPMLLGAVVTLVLVGAAGATPTEKPSALSSQRKLVLTAADFYPVDNTVQYTNLGDWLATTANATEEAFLGPVDFPTYTRVRVDKVELYAFDNNSSGRITLTLYRDKPSTASEVSMTHIDTGVNFADTTDPRTWQTTAITPNVVYSANDTYLYITIDDDTNLYFYGVTIYYRVGK
jgi:hypothetical protein